MTTLAVTDAHPLLWAASGDKRLGRRARKIFEKADAGDAALYVPTIVLVEIAEAFRKGTIQLPSGFEAWGRALFSSGHYHAVDLSFAIVLRANELFEIPERGDRLIAATALELDCPLITCDSEIASAAGVEVIW